MLLQSPLTDDVDQREMFCVYLFPEQQSRKVGPESFNLRGFICFLYILSE